MVPSVRIQSQNRAPLNHSGHFVLYWMIAARRPSWNFALQRAAELASQLQKPLLILEPLRVAYPWACDRFHVFLMQGMAVNARRFRARGVTYFPYLERTPGEGKGLLQTLSANACAVITDDSPAFFLPRAIAAAARTLTVRFEAVDGNGLLPMRLADGIFARAFDFRRFLQKHLAPHLRSLPLEDPLTNVPAEPVVLDPSIANHWPVAVLQDLDDAAGTASRLPIDHAVHPAPTAGGFEEAGKQLSTFLHQGLKRYGIGRNHPDEQVASCLSPYLHFGHVGAHEVATSVWSRHDWSVDRLGMKATGAREGFWNVSEPADAFLDQLVTWRELGFNMAWQRDDHDTYESLPAWARRTLEDHASDPREWTYDLNAFEQAETHDPVWNAAQRELVREGRIHNYLRMLWGKNILAWSESPRAAADIMTELNNKYALDGRDPNSASGIFWVLGRYDRAWGPERPVFGKIRYMTSDSTRRKLKLRRYLEMFQ